jgi:pyrimidine-nucleoside phosphorylase
MIDLIHKKRMGETISKQEIEWMIQSYTNNEIPDYQMSAFLMAIMFSGMTKEETANLTLAMVDSGHIIDLTEIKGVKVDKHSTGGVGDKTSLVLGPLVASLGVPVAKMSGRGLGHTGGTLDKLESIPGFSITLSDEDFIKQVNRIHIAIIGQTSTLAPADKKLYSLRDVTDTVASIPLIASSIMSKKIASGTDAILLDVKYGDGAFMETKEAAESLANCMIEIGNALNRDTRAIISNMNQPLGRAIGNSLEVKEAIDTLNNQGPEDLRDLCLQAGAIMLMQAKVVSSKEEGILRLEEQIVNKAALNTLCNMVEAQGGNIEYIKNPELFDKAQNVIEIKATKSGYIHDLKALDLGLVSMKLGGGRETKEDIIDMSVGLILNKKVGDYVNEGEVLLEVHTNKTLTKELEETIYNAYLLTDQFVEKENVITKEIHNVN